MGASTYSSDDHAARISYRSVSGTPTFKHDADIHSGRVTAAVAKNLDPKGVKIRESRDSDAHPIALPIGVIMDTTGSMMDVPPILEKNLSRLMGCFLDDKASGKKYIGDAYPAILIGAVDDYNAMYSYSHSPSGTLQVGQFESGIEIDNDLENLWLTGHGGGTYEESYDLALYFFARHTVHDHFEKRGRKGYLFLIGDEKLYPRVEKSQVKEIIGDALQDSIPVDQIIAEVKERYHVFFLIPNLTQHFGDPKLKEFWVSKLGQQNVILLDDPAKVCEAIVSAVALCEENVGIDDLMSDGVADGSVSQALAPLAAAKGDLAKYSAESLPAISNGGGGGVDRL